MSSAASAEDVKIGVILGFTGPIESLTPGMGASGELAMKEVSDSGKIPWRFDSDACAWRLHLC
jgi:branched-chain amino acid transport system substrate-binding protein